MKALSKILAISPHLDDAALSYGGQLASLASAGHEVVVYTVFAGTPSPPYSPVAVAYHETWDMSGDFVAPRRAEDHLALSILGVTPIHGSHLDAIYRRDEHGDWLVRDGLPTEHEGDEPDLLADVTSTLEELIRDQRPDRMVTCAAIGAHVDHRRARDAAMMAAARIGVPLALWEDFPYITWCEDTIPELPETVRLSEAVAESLTPHAWQAKIRAFGCYKSQLGMLEEDGPLGELFTGRCAAQASRYGVTGLYEVVRHVTVRSRAAAA